MAKIRKLKNKLLNKKLIFDETSEPQIEEFTEKIIEKISNIDKQKELDKEQQRIKMINDKFKEYNLSITDEEIAETYKRLNEYSEWVDLEGCKFHTIFLKVMEFEMQRDNFQETILEKKPEKAIIEDEFSNFEKELENDRLNENNSENQSI